MIFPTRAHRHGGCDKFTDVETNEFWFWQDVFVAFRHHMGVEPVVVQNRWGNTCGRALSKSFGPDPYNVRRLSKGDFAAKFAETFGTEAGTPEIQHKEPCHGS